MSSVKQRNKCLDAFKGIACIAVVLLHVRIPFTGVDNIVQSMARFAVPLFFMVSGYYCYYDDIAIMQKKLPQKIKHIFKICIASLLYWVVIKFMICLFGMSEHGIAETFSAMFTWQSIVDFIVFNADPVINILWFVFALLYTYIIVYIFTRFKKINILIYSVPFLLVVHFLFGNIAYKIGVAIDSVIIRNCWFMGIPLFMIGYLLRKNSGSVSAKAARNLIFIGFAVAVLEWMFIGGRQQMYIGSIITAAAMIVYSEYYPAKVFSKLLCEVGNKYSLFIYVTHLSVAIVIDRFAKMLNCIDNVLYTTVRPVIVIVATAVFAIIFSKVKDVCVGVRKQKSGGNTSRQNLKT